MFTRLHRGLGKGREGEGGRGGERGPLVGKKRGAGPVLGAPLPEKKKLGGDVGVNMLACEFQETRLSACCCECRVRKQALTSAPNNMFQINARKNYYKKRTRLLSVANVSACKEANQFGVSSGAGGTRQRRRQKKALLVNL